MKFVYYNVNEEDQPYDRHQTIEAAQSILMHYPNDCIVVVVAGSINDLDLAGRYFA